MTDTELEELSELLRPLLIKVTDLEVQVTALNTQVGRFVEMLDGFKNGGSAIAKRLLGVA